MKLALLLLLGALLPLGATAVLSTTTSTAGNVTVCDRTIPSCTTISGSDADSGTSSSASSINVTGFVPDTLYGVGANFNGKADASASYGSLVVSIFVEVRRLGEPPILFPTYSGGAGASAFATFSDTLTITGGSGTGTIDWLFNSCFNLCSGGFNVPNTFTFGVPFNISGSIGISTHVSIFEFQDFGIGIISIRSATVKGGDGNPISGYSVISESGTAYPTFVGSVPEPATWLLTAGGLVGLCLAAKRRFVSFRSRFPTITEQ